MTWRSTYSSCTHFTIQRKMNINFNLNIIAVLKLLILLFCNKINNYKYIFYSDKIQMMVNSWTT